MDSDNNSTEFDENEGEDDFDIDCAVIKNNSEKGCPTVRILANDIAVEALIDTGAQLSVISGNLVQRIIINDKEEIRQLPVTNVTIKGVCGAKKIKQQILINININGKILSWHFLLVNDLSNDIIIGIDALTEFRAEIAITNNWINFRSINEKIKFEREATIFKIEEDNMDTEMKALTAEYAEVLENKMGTMKKIKVKIKMLDERPFKGVSYSIQDIHINKGSRSKRRMKTIASSTNQKKKNASRTISKQLWSNASHMATEFISTKKKNFLYYFFNFIIFFIFLHSISIIIIKKIK